MNIMVYSDQIGVSLMKSRRIYIYYALVPIFWVFILAGVIVYNVCRYVYKWLSYGMTALRAFLATARESRTSDEEELNDTIDFTGFLYDSEQDIFYSKMDAWQRDFGYCRLYDEAATILGMVVDSEPIYFEYGGKKWLIELWKGQYDLTTGGEIGIYTTEGPSINIPGVFNGTFYNSGSDTDLLQMSYSLHKNGKTLCIREDKHWWLTGFKLGEFSEPSELTMKIYITFKNAYMLHAFLKGLKKAGYSDNEIKMHGNTVSFKFEKPKTRQALTRKKVTDWLIQRKNKYLCSKYQAITGPYTNLQDKLNSLREKSPRLYKRIIKIGNTKAMYRKLKTMNDYLK